MTYKVCLTPDGNITKFLAFYRSNFSHSRISPKLHLLEDHVVPWIRRWGVGVGFHGEQGAESIHRVFNSLKRTYASIRKPTDRLKSIMREHYLQNAPANIVLTLVVKRGKESQP